MDRRKSISEPSRTVCGRLAGLVLLLAAAFVGAGQAHCKVSYNAAVAITIEVLMGGDTGDARLFIHPEKLSADQSVRSWKREIFRAPADGWLLFIDPMPLANWEHPCSYVFVNDQTGAVAEYPASLPPETQADLIEITNGRDNPLPGESERAHAWFDRRIQRVPKPPRDSHGRSFAFIISGGAGQSVNHVRYWNDCSFIYKTLANYYQYPDENIYVCISDGLDPAPDRSDGTNSPPDLDGDGDDDIQYPATHEYIAHVFNELATVLTASDQFFIFTTDHGGTLGGWDCLLNLWNFEGLRDTTLAAYIDALPCETVICCFEQCFSGGMIDDLEGDGRVIATACRHDEASWAMSNRVYDEFVYHWISAVNWEDPYGTPVDADTNNDGIVSMQEAFIYAEAHDQAPEHPQYSSTPPELGDLLDLYGYLESAYLVVGETVIDDDMEGASVGNGNGIIEFNETIELRVVLHNIGGETGIGVTGMLATTSSYVDLVSGSSVFGDIAPGGSATNADAFVLHVMHDVPDLENLGFTLEISEEPGILAFWLTARAPSYLVGPFGLDDTAGGNGNGIPEPGEQVLFGLHIENTGGADTPNLTCVARPGCDYFTLDPTPHPLGVIASGCHVTESGFTIDISPSCPAIFTHYVSLDLTGGDLYSAMTAVPFAVGHIFADNMEMESGAWIHYPWPGTAWNDEWHIDTYRNHTPDGTRSWKCGGEGAADYSNRLYAVLETATCEIPSHATLCFYHWIAAEIDPSQQGYCYDGGLLMISTDGGLVWETLTPDGGYPYLVVIGYIPGPLPAETPVWSGTFDWSEVRVDLSGYAGMVKLRWVFGTDGLVTEEGWYIDDVRVYAPPLSGTGDDEAAFVLRPELFPVRPNPALAGGASNVSMRFALPAASEGRLSLYDAGGRLVRVLAEGSFDPGMNIIAWDGRGTRGHLVGSGTYYYRLAVNGSEHTGTVTIVR